MHDPCFSIWSNTDTLTEGPTRHWTGAPQPLHGQIRVDDKTYRLFVPNPSLEPDISKERLHIPMAEEDLSDIGVSTHRELQRAASH